jgi:pimeloyl-ACP methyl ester carboxylesterase
MIVLTVLQLAGCMSLDGLVINGRPKDAYDFSSEVIPEGLIETVTFESEDGAELWGMWARHDPPLPPLMWIHGNGGAMDDTMDRIETYWGWGTHDIFAFDYRGFGRSQVPGTRDGILEMDGLAAARFLSDSTGVPSEEIPWIALSLGSAVAVHTNDEIPAAAIILESMFASTDALLDDGSGLDLPTGWFFREAWDNVEATRSTQSPLFIIHGLADDYVQPDYALEVYAAAPGPRRLWRPEGVAHSDIHEVMPEAYKDRVLDFLADPYAPGAGVP